MLISFTWLGIFFIVLYSHCSRYTWCELSVLLLRTLSKCRPAVCSRQVIKFKLCRCSAKKHSAADQGTVLSLDDVKCHVSNFH